MRKLFLVTVDCDIRADDVALRQESMAVLLDTFEQTGAAGHITWTLNENDFEITKNHQDFLHEALRRGDTLGIHDHFEPLGGNYEFGPALEICRRSKESVEAWLAANGYPAEIPLHRNGCLVQHPEIYRALQELGYTQVSEVWPENARGDREGNYAFDNTEMPVGISPYRHDTDNFADYTSTTGHFLHFPVTHMFLQLGGGFNWETMARWDQAFARQDLELASYLWLFHPYEIMDAERKAIDPQMVETLAQIIARAQSEYGVELASIEECREAIENG